MSNVGELKRIEMRHALTVFELGFGDHDSYYELTDDQLRKLVKLPVLERKSFILNNCEPARISSSCEVAFTVVVEPCMLFRNDKEEQNRLIEESWAEIEDELKAEAGE